MNSISEKELFKRIVIEEIGSSKPFLCKFALELIEQIPSYFWTEAASSTGKHHPEYALGDGGLARHSLMVYRWLDELVRDNPNDFSEYRSSLVVAALFHDCCKRGLPDNIQEHTVFEHPVLASKFVMDRSKVFLEGNKEFLEQTAEDEESFKSDIALAATCIYTHMGRWNTDKHSKVVLQVPRTPQEYIVHLADYCASRKYTLFDNEFFERFRMANEA